MVSDRSARKALARLPGMQGGRVVERLVDGPTNASYRVERGGRQFVLRLDKPEAQRLGLDRENERIVCQAIAEAGFTPAHLHFDASSGICLRPFVAGRSLHRKDLLEPRTLERLAGVLRRLHRLPPLGASFDANGAARRYAAQLGTPEAAALAERAAGFIAEAEQAAVPAVLCHNDLVAENVLETEQGDLLLIDWEYAAVGDPYFDLAVVVRHHGLDDGLAGHLLNAYLEGTASPEASRRLELQCDFYSCLLALWNLRAGPAAEA